MNLRLRIAIAQHKCKRNERNMWICTGNRLLQHKIYVQKIMYTLLLLLVINFEINILKIYHLKTKNENKKRRGFDFWFWNWNWNAHFVFSAVTPCVCVGLFRSGCTVPVCSCTFHPGPPFKFGRIGKHFIPFLCISRSCLGPRDALRIGWWDKSLFLPSLPPEHTHSASK